MSDSIKSVFRQREIEKLWELKCLSKVHYDNDMFLEYNRKLIASPNKEKIISDKVIGEYDVEIPLLETGDEFFLHDIQEVVVIEKKMRSSDGSITYYVEDKMVETENTKKSYDECKEKIEHWYYDKERYDALSDELNNYKREYKYRHRFFNIKN